MLRQVLDQPAYDFMRTNPDLKNVIFLAVSGSRAYGTSNDNSDLDLRGVAIEDMKYLLGLETFEQFEERETDTVIYGLKKFVRLLINANPNTLELLGLDDDCIVHITDKGQLLRDNVGLFLTKRAVSSFGNYALAQLRRLQNALCHDSYSDAQQEKHLRNTLNAQLDNFRTHYTTFPSGALNISTSENRGLILDVELKDYPMVDFVGIYSELTSIVKVYNKLNHRNNKKDDRSLYKHAMHLTRLLMTGIDILNGKGIITKRRNEQALLLDIRNGKFPFEEVFKLADDYQAKFGEAAKHTKLPNEPDISVIDDFLINMYQGTLA